TAAWGVRLVSGGNFTWAVRLRTLTGMRRLGSLMAALACLVALATACSHGGDKATAGRATTTTEAPLPIAFTVTSFNVEAAADPAPGAADGARAGIEATLNVWLQEG